MGQDADVVAVAVKDLDADVVIDVGNNLVDPDADVVIDVVVL